MKKNVIKEIGLAILLLIVIRIFTIYSFNSINLMVTDYIPLLVNDTIITDESLDSSPKALLLEYKSNENYIFYVKSLNKKEVSFVYEGGEYAYNIYINDELRIQNHDETLNGYTNEIPYSVFDIEKADFKEIDGRNIAEVKLQKQTIRETDPFFYLGSKDVIRKALGLRTLYKTFMVICFFMVLVISSVLYKRNRAKYMFIIVLISIVSVFKCIVSGELYIFSNLLGITINNYYFFESATTAINYALYQCMLYTLYEFKFNKRYIISYGLIFIILMIRYVFGGSGSAFLMLYLMGAATMTYMIVVSNTKGKPYSMILLTTYSIFGGFNVYAILNKVSVYKQGYLSSIMNGPQIGSIIYILGFLIAVIKTYLNKIKKFEEQQKEYERVFLIRGIGHDLKLPLSVIKLNNQMLEKYDMAGEEKNVYTKTSLEAVQELEKMTDNINSYLNLESAVGEGCLTSIADSLEKIKNHYNIYNQKNYKFSVICDEKDYLLPIKPLQFDRMLYNLVDNAFKYNKENGEVKVEYILDEKINITVEDSGIGMDQEEINKIFAPFYRIDHSRTKEGLGLGLSVVKGIMESIKGDMKVESNKGIGTKITVTIPK